MAILQISRIQNRRGLQEDLPLPLSSGELGWCLDSRRLYIGNGTLEEHAPALGNTEILTVHSKFSDFDSSYLFSGLEGGGYSAQTGPTPMTPVSRSMQNKFDDVVSTRDFGVKGDGHTNDVDAINRAIIELHKASVLITEPKVRRTLHFPAGIYTLSSDFIKLLPYVKLRGDGKNATYIIQLDSNQPCVVKSDVSTGITSGKLELEDLTLVSAAGKDILQLDSTDDAWLNRVRMQKAVWATGPTNPIITTDTINMPTSAIANTSCVKIDAVDSASFNIVFNDCDFIGTTYGLNIGNTINGVSSVHIIGGYFYKLYRGLQLGDLMPYVTPSAIKVTHSTFDQIAVEGIKTEVSVIDIVSAFNTFKDVGNTSPTKAAVVNFNGKNSYSIGDTFETRDTSDISVVNLHGLGNFATLSDGRVQLGTQISTSNQDLVFLNNTSGNAIIGVGLASTLLEYSILCANDRRTGVLKIVTDGIGVFYEDDYTETSDTGVFLTPALSGNTLVLNYLVNSSSLDPNAYVTVKTTTRTLI